ncbi:hypothetical protein V495_07299 [Pseudogymnoascus sp. VKM F-4514 (FW-929)]|nr:hypothetical protein V495_07299 [Pseudogymnoascus sp. VKM F-4514 (FW-929)]KFY66187.1 hypothetical protein V497_01082 [Pseudogymnoascus sp. VKM F-4516 (FW-969)]
MPSSDDENLGQPSRRPISSDTHHRREIAEDTPLLRAATDVPYYHSTESPDETFEDNELAADVELGDDDETQSEYENRLGRTISYSSQTGIEPGPLESPMLRATTRRGQDGNKGVNGIHRSRDSSVATGAGRDEAGREAKSPFHGGISHRQFWLIFLGLMGNMFIVCFDATIMASSHPVITSYFHSSNSASWLSTAFLLTSTAFQPLSGRLSDTMGRKPPLIFGMVLFIAGTLWCALAQSMTSFIFARALCGLGAGATMTMGSIITSDLVPIEIRGIYQSYINIVYGLGSALGVATGGAMADHLGWRWEFGVQIPPLLLILATSCAFVPRNLGLSHNKENESFLTAMKTFDYKGSLVLTAGSTFLILSLSLGGNIYPWTHPLVLTALSIFVVSTPLLIYIELHAPRPIMPLYLFTRAPRGNLIFSNFVSAVTINAIIFNMPIFFQAVRLETATSSGLRLLVSALAGTICGVSTGFLITWSRRLKWPLVLGAALVFLGPVTLTTIDKDMPIFIILVFLALGSMGQGFQFPGTFMAILAVSEQAEQAVVTSTLMLWRSLGTVIGVASSSLVLQNALVKYLDAFVSGPDKEEVIRKVRGSIEAIAGLDKHYRDQVIAAYSASLRATFIAAGGVGLITLILVLPIRMPRLGKRN